MQGEEGKGAYVTVVHHRGRAEGCRLYYRHAVRLQTTTAHTRHARREETGAGQRERTHSGDGMEQASKPASKAAFKPAAYTIVMP